MTEHGCSSCTSGPTATPGSLPAGCARPSIKSTWTGVELPVRSGRCPFVLRLLLSGLISCAASHVRAADGKEPLVLERAIPLNDVSGRIDHMAVDLRRGRLFVAELGNDAVDVV